MGAASSRPHEEAEDWEDHFQHEYEQPTAANWAEEEEEEASVSVHLGPRLVRRLQQRQSGGAAARRPQQQHQREKQEQQQGFDEAALELDVDEALPPPLSEEELDSIAFSTPLPPLLGDDDVEKEEVRRGASDAATSVAVVPAHRAGGVSQADREFAQQEVAEVRQRFRAEQEKISATEVEQLHKLRGLLDTMTRHRRASEDSCEAERSACLECYAKETDDPLACAAKARAFKQCATAPVRKGAPV